MSTSFARDYRMTGEIAATRDGEILGVRSTILADHGAFDAHAQPGEQYPRASSRSSRAATTCPRLRRGDRRLLEQGPRRHRLPLLVPGHRGHLPDGTHHGRAGRRARNGPGRAQAQELHQEGADALRLRHGLGVRRRRLRRGLDEALRIAGYQELLEEQRKAREEGRIMGIGFSTFTEIVGAGPARSATSLGSRCSTPPSSGCTRPQAILKLGVKSQGRDTRRRCADRGRRAWHPGGDVEVREGDTDNTPFGLGTYASRSTPVCGAAMAIVSRKIREKAKKIAAHMLEACEDDLEWTSDRFQVKGSPDQSGRWRRSPSPPTPMSRKARRPAWRCHRLRPAGDDLPVRRLHLRRRDRPGHGQVEVERSTALDDSG